MVYNVVILATREGEEEKRGIENKPSYLTYPFLFRGSGVGR